MAAAATGAAPVYATTGAGQIRAWRCGEGPDLVVLAGLTVSAAATARAVARACPGWSVTAVELPGIGGSAQCEAATLDEAVDAVAEAVAALVGTPAGLVGLEMSCALLPALATRLGCPATAVGLDRALAWARHGIVPPDLAPRTDGTHLTVLWSFLRDRHVLEPDDPSQAAGSGEPIPTAEELDETFVAAAVRPERFAQAWRLCAGSLEGAAALPGTSDVASLPGALPPRPGIAQLPRKRSGSGAPVPGDRLWHDDVATTRGRMHLRRVGDTGRPLLVIPTGGGSSAQFEPVVRGLAKDRQVFSVDYLGNGLSDKPARETVTIEELAEDMAALVDAMGFPSVDIWGSHTGALVGLELAVRYPDKVGRLVLEGPVFISADFQADLLAKYFPPIRPDGWGRHLQLAWNWRRDMFLFWPWYRAERGAARRLGLPSPQHLHDYAIGILESGPTYDGAYRAAFGYDTRSRLPLLTRPALVCAGPNDMLKDGLAEAERIANPHVSVRTTPTTVWWPDPDPALAAETMAVYDAFLGG